MRAAVWILALGLATAANASADGRKENAVTGDGQGYAAEVVAADIGGVLAVPVIALPNWSSNPWIWTIPLSGLPATLSGPIDHAMHGRWVPAIASFFGWASVVATAWFTGGWLEMSLRTPCNATLEVGAKPCPAASDNSAFAIGAGIGVGALGAVLMTALDAWMARSTTSAHTLEPRAWVTSNGAGAGLGGAF